MATLEIYAGNLERLEALIYGTDPAKARYGGTDKLMEHLLNENALERARAGLAEFETEAGEAALRDLVSGPRPDGPLGRLHALTLYGIVEKLCARIGAEPFGPTTLSALAEFGTRWIPVFGESLHESLSTRRLPFAIFADDVQSPIFSYWMHDEMRAFLKKLPAAVKDVTPDSEALHRLKEVWTDAMGQGPDAILVATL